MSDTRVICIFKNLSRVRLSCPFQCYRVCATLPRAIKCLCWSFTNSRRGFDYVHRKFYISADVTFFESLLYFSLIVSSHIPQLIPSSRNLEKEIVPKPL